MNKSLYNILGWVPLLGPIIKSKTNFFAYKCSPFMVEFMKTDDYKILSDWMKRHPNQIISPKMAKRIIEATNKIK